MTAKKAAAPAAKKSSPKVEPTAPTTGTFKIPATVTTTTTAEIAKQDVDLHALGLEIARAKVQAKEDADAEFAPLILAQDAALRAALALAKGERCDIATENTYDELLDTITGLHAHVRELTQANQLLTDERDSLSGQIEAKRPPVPTDPEHLPLYMQES